MTWFAKKSTVIPIEPRYIMYLSAETQAHQKEPVPENSPSFVTDQMAPWPGFEPGSGGRQPPILDRTILPGLDVGYTVSLLEIKEFLKVFVPRD